MARTKVQSELIATNAISGTIIADGAITSTHLAANCVDSSELVTGSIDTIHIAANQVTATKIVTNGVLTRHISDDQITADKLANSINTDIAAKLPLAGGTLTGALTGTSAAFNSGTTNIVATFTSTDSLGGIQLADNSGNVELVANANNFEVRNAGGSATMVVENGGNVGIGETSPLGKLHVKTADSGASVNSNGDVLVLEDSGSAGLSILSGTSNDSNVFFGDSGNNVAGVLQYSHNGDSFRISSTGQLLLQTGGGNTRMTIDSSGTVGIRTTPKSTNTFHADMFVGPSLYIANYSSGSNQQSVFGNNTYYSSGYKAVTGDTAASMVNFSQGNVMFDSATTVSADAAQTFTTKLYIKNNGNVGIGQTAPASTLHIGDGASHFVRIENAGSGDVSSGYQIYRGSSTGMSLYDNPADNATTLLAAGKFNLITGGSGIDFHIDTSGKVGIGESTPDDTLHVNASGGVARLRIGSGNDAYYTKKGYLGDTWYFGSGETGDVVTSTISGGAFTSSNAGGAFVWKTDNKGTLSEKTRIRSDGVVTTPEQCYFLAVRTSNLNPYNFTQTSGATTAIFTSIVSAQSSASGTAAFSTTDGTFSAPVDGLYLFHVSFYSNITIEQAWITSNGARVSYTDMVANTNGSYTSGTFSSSIQYYMTAGSSIRIHPYSATGNNDYIYDNVYHTYWKGVLLG